jgi:hypothetical protein
MQAVCTTLSTLTPLMLVAIPEVARKHDEKLDAIVVAKRAIERRLASSNPAIPVLARRLCEEAAAALDEHGASAQTEIA